MTKHWLEQPRTIRRLWAIFIFTLALTLAAQIFVSIHGAFGIDATFGFNAWYGFGSCIALIVIAKALGIFLRREDSYYDE